MINEKSTVVADSAQKDTGRTKSLTGTLWPGNRISKKRKGLTVSSEALIQVRMFISADHLLLHSERGS